MPEMVWLVAYATVEQAVAAIKREAFDRLPNAAHLHPLVELRLRPIRLSLNFSDAK